jgi:hypothetical protein
MAKLLLTLEGFVLSLAGFLLMVGRNFPFLLSTLHNTHCTFHLSQRLLILAAEMARYYGSEATSSSIQNIWQRYIRPDVRKLNECLAAGGDPKDVALWGGWVGSPNGRSLHFQSCTLHISFCFKMPPPLEAVRF